MHTDASAASGRKRFSEEQIARQEKQAMAKALMKSGREAMQ
jgi:hypothetical protein